MASKPPLRIGIDIGGTFTDFVVFDPATGKLDTFKLLSTSGDPARAVLDGIRKIRAGLKVEKDLQILHGSTVATNALIERKGAATALITTDGFRDVLQIGRQNRPSLYDFSIDPPEPLVPDHLRFEVNERVNNRGEVLVPLDGSEIGRLASELADHDLESVAVCLLFSFLHPEHEQAVAARLRSAGFFVSTSSEILPEFREYERTSTTVINAYVSPILNRYLSQLEASGGRSQLRVMQSNGGVISLQEARRAGVRCILSGPAGGVIGSHFIAENASPGLQSQADRSLEGEKSALKVITFDMGGTSTDVSVIDGAPKVTSEAEIGGHPIRIPILDIHTIGAGGGSIAGVDLGGALRVGPESARAMPGPACYARGDIKNGQATVTDANLVLGRLDPQNFLGGRMPLDVSRALHVLSILGEQLNLDPVQAALGVVEVANAHMERALRLISVERGYDPRDFILLSFGGAGGLHCGDLARRLNIPRVIIPPMASTLSAFGMLTADVVKDYTQTVMYPDDTPADRLAAAFEPMVARAHQEVMDEGFATERISIQKFVDVRYEGQSYELTIGFDEDLRNQFHQAHLIVYGYARKEAPLEYVNIRVRSSGQIEPPEIGAQQLSDRDPSAAWTANNPVVFDQGERQVPFYRWEQLAPGNQIPGPAVVVRADTTVLIHPDDRAEIDVYENIILQIGG